MNFSLKQLIQWQKKKVLVNLIIFLSCSHDFLCYQSVLCSWTAELITCIFYLVPSSNSWWIIIPIWEFVAVFTPFPRKVYTHIINFGVCFRGFIVQKAFFPGCFLFVLLSDYCPFTNGFMTKSWINPQLLRGWNFWQKDYWDGVRGRWEDLDAMAVWYIRVI